MNENVNVRCWQLVDTRGTSFKFYNIYLAETHLITQWGRINTTGTTRVESFAVQGSATQAALKIHNEKRHKGYELVKKDFDLTIPRPVIANIVISGGSAATILRQPQRPKAVPAEPLDGKDLLRRYGHMVTNLRALSSRADDMDLDTLLDRWSEIDGVWADLEAARTEADQLVATVRAQVTQRVMG